MSHPDYGVPAVSRAELDIFIAGNDDIYVS
jgi:hypothetical protein